MSRIYIVYDERAMYDTDKAGVFTTEDTLEEAERSAKEYGNAVIYSYKNKGGILSEETFESYIRDGEDDVTNGE